MSFRLDRNEATGAAFKRICLAELERAGALLLAARHDPGLIHELRIHLKRLRALLDLAVPVFGRSARTESRALGEVAAMLDRYCETDVLVALLEREARIAGSADFDLLETALRLHQMTDRPPGNRNHDLDVGRRIIAAVRARLARLEPAEPPAAEVRRKFRKSYKRARARVVELSSARNDEAVRALRRENKRLLEQARLLEAWGNERLARFHAALVELDRMLGHGRDGATLAGILVGMPAAEAPLQHGFGLRVRLERTAAEETRQALALARRLYRRTSREFIGRVLE